MENKIAEDYRVAASPEANSLMPLWCPCSRWMPNLQFVWPRVFL